MERAEATGLSIAVVGHTPMDVQAMIEQWREPTTAIAGCAIARSK